MKLSSEHNLFPFLFTFYMIEIYFHLNFQGPLVCSKHVKAVSLPYCHIAVVLELIHTFFAQGTKLHISHL